MNFSLRLAERKTFLIFVDLIIVNSTTLLALWIQAIRSDLPLASIVMPDGFVWFFVFSALWIFSAFLNGFYDPKKITDLPAAATSLLGTVFLVVVAYLVIYFLFATPNALPRAIVLYEGVTSFILIGLWRIVYVLLIQRPTFSRRVVIVGAGWAGKTIAQAIYQHLTPHYRIVGFIDDDPAKQGKTVSPADMDLISLPVLGTCRSLNQIVHSQHVSEVIVAITHELPGELIKALLDCQSLGIQVTLMPLLYEQITGRVPVQHIGDNWYVALPLDHPGTRGIYSILKRTLDILGALIGLTLYAPLFPLLALAIRLDSPGPILYEQERIGLGGKVFRLIKLRTMATDTDKHGNVFTEKNDPRITRVGKFLRKTRLDEFPQLFNILRGDMGAVGPRALSVGDVKRIEDQIPFHRMRLAVRPGMAGWAQVNFGHPTSVEEARIRLEYDLYYIKHQSLWLDLLIILKMIGKMLTLKGR